MENKAQRLTNLKPIKDTIETIFSKKYKKLANFSNSDNILSRITTDYSKFSPHVNGFYYISMIHGPWVEEYYNLLNTKNIPSTDSTPSDVDNQISANLQNLTSLPAGLNNPSSVGTFGNFNPSNTTGSLNIAYTGQVATDIDVPQLNIDYETITGKARSINYASKFTYTGDFSINYIDTINLNVFRYHSAWFKYIELLKKGLIKQNLNLSDKNKTNDAFIDVPYFNAVYILIFEPFTVKVQGVIKILGASPINLPIKQIMGDRSKSALSTINQNYKSNDMIFEFYENSISLANSSDVLKNAPLLTEYLNDHNIELNDKNSSSENIQANPLNSVDHIDFNNTQHLSTKNTQNTYA